MKRKISDWVLGFIYMMLILSLSVTVTLNFRQLYYQDIERLKISESTGLGTEEIKKNYDALIDYNTRPGIEKLQFPTFSMSEEGRIHFEEVKRIFVAVLYILAASLILGIGSTIYKCKKKEYGFLKAASILTVFLPAILGIFVAANWDKAFVTFHHIFFKNDYWIFNPAVDPVITILPDTFFLHCAVMILSLTVAGAVICAGTFLLLRKKKA